MAALHRIIKRAEKSPGTLFESLKRLVGAVEGAILESRSLRLLPTSLLVCREKGLPWVFLPLRRPPKEKAKGKARERVGMGLRAKEVGNLRRLRLLQPRPMKVGLP